MLGQSLSIARRLGRHTWSKILFYLSLFRENLRSVFLACVTFRIYSQRLKQLNLERLDVRRLRADLLLAYKIVFGTIADIDISQFLPFVGTSTTLEVIDLDC